MAELSKIRKNGVDYGIKDETAREAIKRMLGDEPAEEDIPKVFITGVKPTTKDDVLAEMEYVSKTECFHAYLKIKCQGTSSLQWPKKNFTVKLYSDEARETKLKKDFKDWNHPGNKFVLKANYIDHSHARNIVSARLWGEVVESRPDYNTLPEEMRNSPNNGAVDGFPIKVYYNGTYEGVYTWNIGKDDWMWGMDEENPNHVLMCAETNTDGAYKETPCNFRKLWNGVNETDWSVEVGTNSTALKNSLNNLIQFVMDNNGDAFRNGIGNYLDIQSAIDYYILQYEICGLDGLAKNMLLATYNGTKWICGAYDMDSTFGLWWDGSKFVSATFACPENYQERYSLLWERIEANFLPELKARQAELRKTVLSYSNMVTHFERFMDIIGLDLYAEDLTIYTGIPLGSSNNIKQIRDYIRDRQAYVDAEFAAMSEHVPCTSIVLDKSTLRFENTDTQIITATLYPAGATDRLYWISSDATVAKVDQNGIVTPVSGGTAIITAKCGDCVATCNVTVVHEDVLYELQEETMFASLDDAINTGVPIVGGSDKDFTIALDITQSEELIGKQGAVFNASYMYGGVTGFSLRATGTAYYLWVYGTAAKTADAEFNQDVIRRAVFVMRHAKDSGTYEITTRYGVDGAIRTSTVENEFVNPNGVACNLWIGCADGGTNAMGHPWIGTMHRFKVLANRMTDDEVTAFIDGMTE